MPAGHPSIAIAALLGRMALAEKIGQTTLGPVRAGWSGRRF
jgi:hypothetical protein